MVLLGSLRGLDANVIGVMSGPEAGGIFFCWNKEHIHPETNITPEIGPSQKEIHLPTTYFQGIFVSFRECFFCRILKRCLAVWWCLHIVLFQCGLFLSLWPPVLSIPIHPFEVTWRNPAEVIMEISMNTLWISKRNLCQFVSENIACQYVNKALPHGGESLDQKKLEKMWFCVHCF